MSNKTIKILESHYHRNGISGVGFYATSITWVEDGKVNNAVATVSASDVEDWKAKRPHDPQTRVLMIRHTPTGGSVDLADTMRGDWFHDEMCKQLVAIERADRRKRLRAVS